MGRFFLVDWPNAATSENERHEQALKLVEALSQQEQRFLAELVNGRSTNAIAAMLSLAPHEAERAKQVLMDKLYAKSTADAVRTGIYANVQRPG